MIPRILQVGVVVCALAAVGVAQGEETPPQATRAQLKKSMAGRYAALVRLKAAGKIGETYTGEVGLVDAKYGAEVVDPKAKPKVTLAEFVKAENKDRKALYAVLARELKSTAKAVAQQNAVRSFSRAKPTEFLQLTGGRWMRKRDFEAEKKRRKKQGAAG